MYYFHPSKQIKEVLLAICFKQTQDPFIELLKSSWEIVAVIQSNINKLHWPGYSSLLSMIFENSLLIVLELWSFQNLQKTVSFLFLSFALHRTIVGLLMKYNCTTLESHYGFLTVEWSRQMYLNCLIAMEVRVKHNPTLVPEIFITISLKWNVLTSRRNISVSWSIYKTFCSLEGTAVTKEICTIEN